MKHQKILCTSLTIALLFTACSTTQPQGQASQSSSDISNSAASSTVDTVITNSVASSRYAYPTEATQSATGGTAIALSDDMNPNAAGVSFADGVLTISKSGTYVLSGTLHGSIVIDVDKDETVFLILNGATVSATNGAALWAKHGTLVLTLAENSENNFTDSASYSYTDTDAPNAAIYSKDDLYLNGSGSLTVTAQYNDAIATKDDLVITSGNFTINAVGDALRGRDAVAICGGTFALTAGNDGIKATHDTDASKGAIYLDGGNFTIAAAHDGIQAASDLYVTNGTVALTTGGGAGNAAAHTGDAMFAGGNGMTKPQRDSSEVPAMPNESITPPTGMDDGTAPSQPPMTEKGERGEIPQFSENSAPNGTPQPESYNELNNFSTTTTTATETETTSAKGLKANGSIYLSGGTFTVDCADDALHANGNITITDGTFTLATGDDGVHADDTLTISGGMLTVTQSYEGLEATDLIISGGSQFITASDDGVNAAGGNNGTSGNTGYDFFSRSTGSLTITGGTLWVHAGGDGLDANGSIEITGGLQIINGPTNSGNGALDYDNTCTVSGGTLLAFGASGMVQSTSSGQPTLMITFSANQTAGTTLQVCSQDGTVLFGVTSAKSFNSAVITSPLLTSGSTYTIATTPNAIDTPTGYAESGTQGSPLFTVTLSDGTTSVSDSGQTVSAGMGGMMGAMGGRGTR